MLKGLGNLASIMRQAQQFGGKMQSVTERLKGERVTASAGGGMVEVEANGLGEILHVKIDAALVERGEREMIEDLIPAAVNQAQNKARLLHMQAMKSFADGLDLPGLNELLSREANPESQE